MNVQHKAQPINMAALCWTFIGSAVLCYAYADYVILCAIALSHSVKTLSVCISVRLAVRCFYATSLSRAGFVLYFALCFASGLRYWFRILLCFGLSCLVVQFVYVESEREREKRVLTFY